MTGHATTLREFLNSNRSKYIFWKFSEINYVYRFSPSNIAFLSSYLQKMKECHKQNCCLNLGKMVGEHVAFESNMFNNVLILKPSIKGMRNGKEQDFLDLAEFIADMIDDHELPAYPHEIRKFLALLKNPNRTFKNLIGHYSLWDSEKRENLFSVVYKRLWEGDRPGLVQQSSHVKEPKSCFKGPQAGTIFSNRAPFFKDPQLLFNLIGNKKFWEVFGESVLLTESYKFAENIKSKKSNYEPFHNDFGGLLKLIRHTFIHSKTTTVQKYPAPRIEFEFYCAFPLFLSVMCEELDKLGLYHRLSCEKPSFDL